MFENAIFAELVTKIISFIVAMATKIPFFNQIFSFFLFFDDCHFLSFCTSRVELTAIRE